jgi:hypothetical protein
MLPEKKAQAHQVAPQRQPQEAWVHVVFSPMKPNVIVWDLETVPDLAGFAAA